MEVSADEAFRDQTGTGMPYSVKKIAEECTGWRNCPACCKGNLDTPKAMLEAKIDLVRNDSGRPVSRATPAASDAGGVCCRHGRLLERVFLVLVLYAGNRDRWG